MTDNVTPPQRPARHFSVEEKLRWLEPNPNLPPHLHVIAGQFQTLAMALLRQVEDSPQLTLALQHLIDAKDCAVRAKIAEQPHVLPSEPGVAMTLG
jgi:hypothetical protein